MSEFIKQDNEEEVLDLKDLLVDDNADDLSDYLALSIQPFGEDTRVSVTTVEESPVTYATTLNGVSISNLQFLIDNSLDINVD